MTPRRCLAAALFALALASPVQAQPVAPAQAQPVTAQAQPVAAPAVEAAAEPASRSTLAQELVGAINDAGRSVSLSVTQELETAEVMLADVAGKAVLYLAIALGLGLAFGMVLGSLLSALVLRGTIRRALAAAR